LHHLLDGASSEEESDIRVARMLSAGFGPGEAAPPNVPHPVVVQVVNSLGRLGNRRSPTVGPAMKILGALASTNNPGFTDLLIGAGALKALRSVLTDAKSATHLRKDAAWILSNIAAGGAAQVQKLLDEPGAYDALKAALEHGPTSEVRRECAWGVANLARQGAPLLSRMDCRELLRLLALSLATVTDPALQRALLEAAEVILRHSGSQAAFKGLENPLAQAAEGFGFLETLEELQHAESEAVYRKAVHILEEFFGADAENVAPEEQAPITPSAGKLAACMGTSILGNSPARPGYKFGA